MEDGARAFIHEDTILPLSTGMTAGRLFTWPPVYQALLFPHHYRLRLSSPKCLSIT